MVHKKEEGTYHCIERLRKDMPGFLSPGKVVPLLLIPEYSRINKEKRIPDIFKIALRKPPVQCFLTANQILVCCSLWIRNSSKCLTNVNLYKFHKGPKR